MVRSQLPLPFLLGLFGTLLMLSPELLMGIAEGLSDDVPITDLRVQVSFLFSVEKYNQGRNDSTNYFKVLNVLEAQEQRNVCYFIVVPSSVVNKMDIKIKFCLQSGAP